MKKLINKLFGNSIIVVLGAIGVAIIMVFFQSPPTRAEFDSLKYKQDIQYKHVCELFKEIKADIKEIKHMIYKQTNPLGGTPKGNKGF